MIDRTVLQLGAKAHQELLDDFSQRYSMVCKAQVGRPAGDRRAPNKAAEHIINEMQNEFGHTFEAPPCRVVWELFLESVEAHIKAIEKL